MRSGQARSAPWARQVWSHAGIEHSKRQHPGSDERVREARARARGRPSGSGPGRRGLLACLAVVGEQGDLLLIHKVLLFESEGCWEIVEYTEEERVKDTLLHEFHWRPRPSPIVSVEHRALEHARHRGYLLLQPCCYPELSSHLRVCHAVLSHFLARQRRESARARSAFRQRSGTTRMPARASASSNRGSLM